MGMTERKRGDGMERPTPYRDAAMTYRRGGWQGVLPVPFRTKKLTKPGWTGHEGGWPSGADIQAWMDSEQADEGRGNIAVRMPPDVIGIDVDAYGGKSGKESYFAAEAKWGELPRTWMSTARVDGFSGIRFFKIPEGLRWPGQVGPGIETVHVGHRYAMVWPSVHPEGNTYKWYRPDGMGSIEPPGVDDLPELPEAWVLGLTGGELAEEVAFADMGATDVNEWVARHLKFGVCRPMEVVRDRLLTEMRTGSAHESLRRLMGLIRLAEQGHSGLAEAMGLIKDEFVTTVMSRGRSAQEADGEWHRSLNGAVRRVLGVPSIADHDGEVPADPCAAAFGGAFDGVLAPGDLQAAMAAVEHQRVQTGSTGPVSPAMQAVHTVNGVAVAGDDDYSDDEDDVVVVELPTGPAPTVSPSPESNSEPVARERSTWWPVNLTDVLSGKLSEPPPVVLGRTDGINLFYAGKVNGLLGESESGKAQPYDAPIATPDGWTTMGELVVGSTILGSDGGSQTVTAIHERGDREIYEVTTGQGVMIEACGEHLWAVKNSNDVSRGSDWRVLTTEQIEATQRRGSGSPQWRLPMPEAARFIEGDALPVDPYLLGLLIGDGCLTREVLFTNPEPELHKALLELLPAGCIAVDVPGEDCPTVRVRGAVRGDNALLFALRRIGLMEHRSVEKFLPEVYLRASVTDRLALLQGLMDTDGGMENRSAIFSTSSPRLADDVCELVRSLGGTATPHWRIPTYQGGEGSPACRVSVILPRVFVPFRLPRKLNHYLSHSARREPVNRITQVRRTGRFVPMRCIAVSNSDRLYRTTGHTLTHNTWVALLAVKECIEQGADVLYLDFEDTAAGVVGRLISMGVDADDIMDHFHYSNPEESLNPLAQVDLAELMVDHEYMTVVVDGVNAAMTLFGLDLMSNTDCTKFSQILLKPMARRGSVVIAIDHVSKSKDGRGKGGIGGQAKRAMMTGCALFVEPLVPFARGVKGLLKLTVDKDRAGHVRAESEGAKVAGMVTIDSDPDTGNVKMWIAPADKGSAGSSTGKFGGAFEGVDTRPTVAMRAVSNFIAGFDGMPSGKKIEEAVSFRATTVRDAIHHLEAGGYVRLEKGPRGASLHKLIKPFTELDDLVVAERVGEETYEEEPYEDQE